MAKRNDDLIFEAFVGYNSTGKTSIANKYAKTYHTNNPKLTIAGYDPQKKFTDLINPKYSIASEEKGWWGNTEEDIKKRLQAKKYPLNILRNSLIVLDDYRSMFKGDNIPSDLLRLMEFRFEHGLDIILSCHSPGMILERFTPYISHYYIFYTKGKEDKFEAKMENYVECQRALSLCPLCRRAPAAGRSAPPAELPSFLLWV